jgi:hypothetical protein
VGLKALPAAGSEASRPTEEAHQLRPFLPQKKPEVFGVDGVSFAAGISFDTPLEVFAAPWGEPMASCRIPQKADRHGKAPLTKYIQRGQVRGASGVANGRVRLDFGLQHVRDQFVGQILGADVIGSVGHGLF